MSSVASTSGIESCRESSGSPAPRELATHLD